MTDIMSKWMRWFAWHPVKCEGRIVWLRTIHRRFVLSYGGDFTEYRLIQEPVSHD